MIFSSQAGGTAVCGCATRATRSGNRGGTTRRATLTSRHAKAWGQRSSRVLLLASGFLLAFLMALILPLHVLGPVLLVLLVPVLYSVVAVTVAIGLSRRPVVRTHGPVRSSRSAQAIRVPK